MDITPIAGTPDHIKGVINLRGRVIPVINLRSKFGMAEADITDQTCIIIVRIRQHNRQTSIGIVVDRVSEVLDIDSKQIEPTPHFDSTYSADFILGMGKIGTSVKILLDIDRVLASDNFPIFK